MTDEKKSKKEKKETPEKEKKPRRLLGSLRKKKEVDEKKKEEKKAEPTRDVDPLGVLRFVLMTEKSIRMIEAENKLIFIVNKKASKNDIAAAFEKAFDSQVAEVRTQIDQKGRKRALIKLETPGAAGEIAIRLGII